MLELIKILQNFSNLLQPQYYKEWVDHFKRVTVHTRKKPPADVLLKARPNEQPDVTTYRLENYREITYASMVKAFDRLFRIFNALSFSWEAIDVVKNYIKENKFQKNSFGQFMSTIVLKNTIDDPNGLLVWLPDGEGLKEKTKKVSPRPEIVESSAIKKFDDDILIYRAHIDIAKYKIEVEEGEYESYVILTKEEYGFFFYYKDSKKDWYIPQYQMKGFNELPVIVFGGIDCGGYYESFFSPFLAYGDEAIARFSDWQGVTIMCGYPQIDELQMDCDAPGCIDGHTKNKAGEIVDCNVCHGSGIKPNKGPFGVFRRKVPDTDEKDESLSVPSRRFNSPDTDMLDTMFKNWKEMIEMGEDALRIVNIKEPQSGIAKDIDREDGDSTINKISDRHFDIHWWYSLKYIGMYLMPEKYDVNTQKINKPTSFRIRTVSELLQEIADLKAKNAPIIIILNVVKELFYKRFSYDEVSKKIFDVIFENDPLSVYSVLESQSLLMANSIQPQAMTTNLYLFQTLLKISKEMGENRFIDAETDDLYKKSLDKMNEFKTTAIPPITEPIA